MTKNVLIPSDFDFYSINLLKAYLSKQDLNDGKVNIILLKGVNQTSSITDLLFFKKSKLISSITQNDFDDACDIIKNKFSSIINAIRKDIFTGYNQNAFENYLEANHIDVAIIPNQNIPYKTSTKSFNIIPFIERSPLKVEIINVEKLENISQNDRISEVLFGNITASR